MTQSEICRRRGGKHKTQSVTCRRRESNLQTTTRHHQKLRVGCELPRRCAKSLLRNAHSKIVGWHRWQNRERALKPFTEIQPRAND